MKTDREFLNAIYEKAKILEEKKINTRKKRNSFLQLSSIAALLILIPLVSFKDQILKPGPGKVNEIEPHEIRMFIMDHEEYFSQADYIAIGEEVGIEAGKVNIEIQRSFLGDINGLIELDQQEGFGSKRVLLFLKGDGKTYSLLNEDSYFIEIGEDVFQDRLGNSLNIQDIEDKFRRSF